MTSDIIKNFQITASGRSTVHVGDNIQLAGTNREILSDRLLPNWRLSNSLNPYWDHYQAKEGKVDGSGEWLVESKEFRSWKANPNSFLWLHGIAGCGKTVLSSTIIDHLQDLFQDNDTAGYYFIATDREKRSVFRLLRSLLVQICPTDGKLPCKLEKLWDKSSPYEILDDEVLEALKDLMNGGRHTYIVIDALDECGSSDESSTRAEINKLVNFIDWLTRIELHNLHVLVTSRSRELRPPLEKKLSGVVREKTSNGYYCHVLDLQAGGTISNVNHDIGIFVDSELESWNDYTGERYWIPLGGARQDLIAKSVKSRANGMFLLAVGLLNLLWEKEDWSELENSLADLPSNLPEIYDRIFELLGEERRDTARILFRWLLHCERPLSLDELTEIVAIGVKGDSFAVKNIIPDKHYVSRILSGLVVITDDSLVQFAHQTVKEYLILYQTEGGFFSREAISQRFLAISCLSYMQFCDQSVPERPPTHDVRRRFPNDYLLIEYVFNNWYKHALGAWGDAITPYPTGGARNLSDEASSPGITHRHSEPGNYTQSLSDWAGSVKLWLSRIGNIGRLSYHKALKAFACEGYAKFVELTSPTGAREWNHIADKHTWEVVLNGRYSELVCLILDTAVDRSRETWWPEKGDPTTEVGISHKSYELILRSLLGHGLDTAWVDSSGLTLLHIVAFQGLKGIAELLVAKGYDINAKDHGGQTALHIASSHGHDEVIRVLLEGGADIGAKNKLGWTALDVAVLNVAMVFTPDYTNSRIFRNNRLTMPQAVPSSHETIARTICALSGRSPDLEGIYDLEIPDVVSQNPPGFSWSSWIHNENMHESTTIPISQDIKLARQNFDAISSLGTVYIKELNTSGESAVTFSGTVYIESLYIHNKSAVTFSGTVYIKSLYIHGESAVTFSETVYIESLSIHGESAVSFSGTVYIKSLYIHGESAVTFSGTVYIKRLPIHGKSAVTFSETVYIKRLPIHGESAVTFSETVYIESLHIHGKSTITFSETVYIKSFHIYGESTVTLSGSVYIKELNTTGRSAVTFSGMVYIESLSINGSNTTFFGTAYIENLTLNWGVVNFLSSGEVRKLVHHRGNLNIVRGILREMIKLFGAGMIIEDGGCENNIVRIGGYMDVIGDITTLHLAVRCGYDAIARLLLEKGANPNVLCHAENGRVKWTALHLAVFMGRKATVELLLEMNADVNIRDKNGQTALQIADSRGHTEIVQLLEEWFRERNVRSKIAKKVLRLLRRYGTLLFSKL
ncbi:uncharacterized protein F4807DRAFT_183125 [Annulohypoxylon truncatum]|uniref:uncharacterized protein n=1 Tax=Annulohypoxylon truncatum TaxID=327061 RepID=UPI0020080077|nr:uncharacterized protein F4807DRAFT_183125 [Annulohypoxylon truncatum]KAI1207284.1 hypothetical protein F4807DRAFT_183125 [Annulohypoxylon truncatum]